MSFRNMEEQTARSIQRLQEYNFTSEHRQTERTTTPMLFQYDHAKRNVHIVTKSRRGQT
jgi:hypothetical protein